MAQSKEAKKAYSKAGRAALRSLKQMAGNGGRVVAGEVVPVLRPTGSDRDTGKAWVTNIVSVRPAIAEAERLVRQYNERFGEDWDMPVVVTVAGGGRRANHPVRPWLAAVQGEAWSTREGQAVHEIALYAEFLNWAPLEIAETIIHELVHIILVNRGDAGTSAGGYRHNRVFAETAEQFGLVATKEAGIGYRTSLAPDTVQWLEQEFKLDVEAFGLFKKLVPPKEAKPRKSRKAWACACAGEAAITIMVPAGRVLRAQCHICETDYKEKT